MLPTHMLCWQYENWLRRLLLGLVAIESAAAYGIEKCLGLVGKTEERCAFLFFYIVFRVTGIYARLWILSTWNKKLLPHTSEQKWEESVKPTLRYGLCQTKTATSLRGNAEACRFTHFECYLLHSGSQPRKCRKNFGLWRDKVSYAENILRI